MILPDGWVGAAIVFLISAKHLYVFRQNGPSNRYTSSSLFRWSRNL